MTDIRFKWIKHPDEAQRRHVPIKDNYLHSVGLNADGSLHNPNGYPEEIVRRAVVAAIARVAQRRKDGAAKAAITRKRRRDKRVREIAAKMLRDEKIGPSRLCCVCRRELADDVSITRGVGSECWQDLLKSIDRMTEAA